MNAHDSLCDLFIGSPFLPAAPSPHDIALRGELREKAWYAGVPFTSPAAAGIRADWNVARLALADRLEEDNDPEQWLARLEWRCTATLGCVVKWFLPLPAAPDVGQVASRLVGAANSGPLLGWRAGELKVCAAASTGPVCGLRLTAMRQRAAQHCELDTVVVPGGLKGLAWLAARHAEANPCTGPS